MIAQAVLELTNVGNPIAAVKDMTSWIRVSFNQLVGAKDAEKTASEIVGSAIAKLSLYISSDSCIQF